MVLHLSFASLPFCSSVYFSFFFSYIFDPISYFKTMNSRFFFISLDVIFFRSFKNSLTSLIHFLYFQFLFFFFSTLFTYIIFVFFPRSLFSLLSLSVFLIFILHLLFLFFLSPFTVIDSSFCLSFPFLFFLSLPFTSFSFSFFSPYFLCILSYSL